MWPRRPHSWSYFRQVHDAPAKPNYVAWLGGAIFAALDAMASRSIPRDAYRQHRVVPDWNCPSAENPYKDIASHGFLGSGLGYLEGRGSTSSPLLRLRSSATTTGSASPATTTTAATASPTALTASLRSSRKSSTASPGSSGSGERSPASAKKMDTS